MIKDFTDMPPESKVWIFQAPRSLFSNEINIIKNKINKFIDEWESHGHKLKASYLIHENIFLILAVDENQAAASGCSIDKAVHAIKEIEGILNLPLLDRTFLAFQNKNTLEVSPLKELKQLIAEGTFTPETVIYNNSVTTLDELNTLWKIPAGKSWVSKYFNN
jgi:hypothetical protein